MYVVIPFANAVERERTNIEKLNWIKTADPITDGLQAVKNNNCKLLGIRAAGLVVPLPSSVSKKTRDKYVSLYGYKLIDGTNDSFRMSDLGAKRFDLQQKAGIYARTYNFIIINGNCKKK